MSEPGGGMRFLYDESLSCLLTLGEAQIIRASHVEPERRLLRAAFHLLRRVCGEKGRVARWTRRWPCRWRVNLAPVGGGLLGVYTDREDAIDAEIAWIEENVLTRPGACAPELPEARAGFPVP